jgi:ribosomal protein S18 acetylase RimI-like enzyme
VAAASGARAIRLYEDRDHRPVRQLFIAINRELAPVRLRAEFEQYIAVGLREEMDRIPDYYRVDGQLSFWVMVDGDCLLGTVALERTTDVALDLRRLYVNAAFRGQGIGRWMLQHAERTAVAMGYREMLLSTSELQTAAIALYRRDGYQLIREEVATDRTSKQAGAGLTRYYFRKQLPA